ncbi:unnamed protein product [Brugia pahangi]|uniref:Secreted protein n=1 Tax=Brugia pahangi TaxID=6280 RepID=A0A0N4TPF7_BRUPA|nr:unnamed protein product [Brugia pahangi]
MHAPAAAIAGNGMTALRTTVMTVKWCGGGVGAVHWWWCCSLIIMHDRFQILLFVLSRTFHLQNVNLRRATIIHPICLSLFCFFFPLLFLLPFYTCHVLAAKQDEKREMKE